MVSAGRYYHDEDVVSYFTEATEGGLTEREQGLVESYFTGQAPTVLDLGCGAGRTTGPLEARGFDVVGVDMSEAMITAARENTSGPELLVGDATDLPFEDECFDYVLFSRCGLDDVVPEQSRYEALREAYRVLRPGGRFGFDSNNAIHRYIFDPASLEDVRSHL
ncbi:class I SAM-dependent methyltransferase [Haloarchaeobius sp. HRN-SO-5]|uniref:class I SAM-dependent methyltransferase n=1 Tax=Haloarchaeobius sp. HRN-SO-5 TaxID=3446118 RepID=UPI003EBE1298